MSRPAAATNAIEQKVRGLMQETTLVDKEQLRPRVPRGRCTQCQAGTASQKDAKSSLV